MFHINPTAGKTEIVMSDFIVDEDHQYQTPSKCVKTQQDMQLWEKSEAYYEYLGFILAINEAVCGKRIIQGHEQAKLSPTVIKILELLERLSVMIDETPALVQPQRFGNKAFRDFYQKLKDQAVDLIKLVLPVNLHRSIPEIMYYFVDGFGNSTRIDYGTGHEISFLMFVCCLFKIGALTEEDKVSVACAIFAKYLIIVRKLQQTYRMEPAGSHGVWSLDDHQFVPFIWGSSQLIQHPTLDPSSFLRENIVDKYANEYLFMGCIQYINKVKKGPFAEHSNQLWGISGVSSWSKINGGLIKMYKVEVLGKFPVAQHIVFGSLLPINPAEANSALRKTRMSSTPPISPVSSLTEVQTDSMQVGEDSETKLRMEEEHLNYEEEEQSKQSLSGAQSEEVQATTTM